MRLVHAALLQLSDAGSAAVQSNVVTSRRWVADGLVLSDVWAQNAKPSQAKALRAETCVKRKSTSLRLLAIPAFDRIAELYNRHYNSNWGICLR